MMSPMSFREYSEGAPLHWKRMLCSRRWMWVAGAVFALACATSALAQDTAPDAPQPQSVPQSPPVQPSTPVAPPTDARPTPPLQSPPRSDGKEFPFPGEDKPPAATTPSAGDAGKAAPPTDKKDFPFPDETPKPAATATPPKTETAPPPPPQPGYSSSSSSGLHDEGSSGGETIAVPDAKRADKDKSVARFYWNVGDYAGSYLRYKDAVNYAPRDPEMWFGLADSERMLGKYTSAREHYQKYLQIAPQGSQAKEAAKYLHAMPEKDKPQPAGPGPHVP